VYQIKRLVVVDQITGVAEGTTEHGCGFGWHLGGRIRRPRVGVSGRRWDPTFTQSGATRSGRGSCSGRGRHAVAAGDDGAAAWVPHGCRMGARDGGIVDGGGGIGWEAIFSS
jgi:hypothetical protein